MKLITTNKNKPGYKKTNQPAPDRMGGLAGIGWIPNEWESKQIGELSEVLFSNVDKKTKDSEKPVFLCNYMDVYYNDYITEKLDFMQATASESEINKFSLKQGDVIITKDSETFDDIAVSTLVNEELINVLCGYHLAVIRPNRKRLLGEYLTTLFKLHPIRHYFSTLANGVTRFGLNNSSVNHALIPIPPLPEQKKIAAILSTWDRTIEKMNKLISAKEHYKKGLMHRLLTGKVRFKSTNSSGFIETKQGSVPTDWLKIELRDILEFVQYPVAKPNKPYIAMSIKSHCKGTFLRDVDDPTKVQMDTLYSVQPNHLIINITFGWEGAIAITSESNNGALVSHRFPMFRFKKSSHRFWKYFIQHPKLRYDLIIVSPGGAGRNRVLSKNQFLKLEYYFPSEEEQNKIASVLSACDKEIELLKQEKSALEQQKKGLMQRLLTGVLRVNMDSDPG